MSWQRPSINSDFILFFEREVQARGPLALSPRRSGRTPSVAGGSVGQVGGSVAEAGLR
jgi:hypothetical protein